MESVELLDKRNTAQITDSSNLSLSNVMPNIVVDQNQNQIQKGLTGTTIDNTHANSKRNINVSEIIGNNTSTN